MITTKTKGFKQTSWRERERDDIKLITFKTTRRSDNNYLKNNASTTITADDVPLFLK